MTSRAKTLTFAIVAAAGAYLGAKYAWPLAEGLAEAPVAPLPLPLTAMPDAVQRPPVAAMMAPVEDEAFTGVLIGDAIELTARIDTKVKSLSFRVGDSVRTGDAIAELDTTSQQLEIAAAEASIRASRAEGWSASLAVSQAREKQNRRGRVVKVGSTAIAIVSDEELSDSKFDSLSASSRASAAGAVTEERIARLASLKQVVTEATLRASFDGIVATRFVEVGAHVRPGTPIVRIVGRGGLRVRFAVPETDAAHVPLRSRVVIDLDGRALNAVVDRIAPEVESTSSTIIMEAEVETAPQDAQNTSALAGRVVGVRIASFKSRG